MKNLSFEGRIFELASVIQHLGPMSGGHYIAWIRTEGGWNVYDDVVCTSWQVHLASFGLGLL